MHEIPEDPEKPKDKPPRQDLPGRSQGDQMDKAARKQLQDAARDDTGGARPMSDGGVAPPEKAEPVKDKELASSDPGIGRLAAGHRSSARRDRPDEKRSLSAAHAGAAMGELDAAFILGQRGFEIVLGPGGEKGHKLNQGGPDTLAFDPKTGELCYVDNKAKGDTRRVRAENASALTTNLRDGLADAVRRVEAIKTYANRDVVLQKLNAMLTALEALKPLPKDVRLVVTNAGGYSSGIGKDLAARGVEFVDLVGPAIIEARRADIRAARAQGIPTGRPVTNPVINAEPASGSQQVRAERVDAAALGIAAVLDTLSNALAHWQIQREVEKGLNKQKVLIERTLESGTGVFVVVLIEQSKFQNNNGDRVRHFNTLDTLPAASYQDGIAQWRLVPTVRSSRGENWENVYHFAFIPPR